MQESDPGRERELQESRRRFFARPLPPGYAAEVAAALREPLDSAAGDTHAMLLFRIGAFQLALPSRSIVAIAPMRPACSIPNRRKTALLGLMAYAGEVIPACSLSRILGAADRAGGPEARTLILAGVAKDRWAVPVDAVLRMSNGVLRDRSSAEGMSGSTSPQPGTSGLGLGPAWSQQIFADAEGQITEVLHMPTLLERMRRSLN